MRMFARIIGGFVIATLAWTVSCFGDSPDRNVATVAASNSKATTAIAKPGTTTTSTTTTSTTIAIVRPTVVAVTTTSTSTTTTTSTTTSTTTTSTTLAPEADLIDVEYRYYERSPRVVALQEELGLRSVDGVYGPQTRKAHIEALGGPSAAVIIFYPELFEAPTPCSHGCLPGDSHYQLPTLGELINKYFLPEDRELAHQIAFCESSARSWHIGSEVVSHAFAIGWFQHLAKYWPDRSKKAGWEDYHPFHAEANVAVAAWLFYSSGIHHWNPSKSCWEDTTHE